MAEKFDNNLKRIEQLVKVMNDNGLIELEIVDGDSKILLKRPQPPIHTVNAMPAPVLATVAPVAVEPSPSVEPEAAEGDDGLVDIISPIIGTFYSAASPDSDPFVEVGSDVNDATVVCIVEAMKVMNEIKAECTGTIEKVLVSSGQAIEYGQVLFKVSPH